MSRTAAAYLAVLATIIMWSHAFVAIKYCLRSVTPWELVILRHVPAAILFAAYWVIANKKAALVRMMKADGATFALLGLIAVAGYHGMLNTGIRYISAGTASVIVGTAPVFTFLVAALLIGERPTWTKGAGIVLAFAGLYLCVRYGGGKRLEVAYLIGALIALLAPFLASFHTVLSRPLSQRHGALNVASIILTVGTVPLLFTVRPALIAKLPSLSWRFWAADLFLGLGCTATAHVLWTYGLRHIEATKVSAFLYLLPLLGILWGWLYLDEKLTYWLVLGGLTVVAGIALINRRTKILPASDQRMEPGFG